MATRIFQWGTVRSTPKGVVLVFGSGNRFDLSFDAADSVERYIDWGRRRQRAGTTRILLSPPIRLEWSSPGGYRYQSRDPLTPGSILKIGLSVMGGRAGWRTLSWAPGTTPTLLIYDDAMELADAIRFVVRSVQTQTATAVP